MITQLEVEAVFAEMGLPAILAAKPRLSRAVLGAAGGRELSIRRRLLRFLARDAWDDASELPSVEYDQLLGLLKAGKLQPNQTQAVFGVVPDAELAQDVCELADKVIGWANGAIPRGEPDPITGQVVDEPPRDALLDFRRLWGVAINPMAVLADLGDGSLTDDQMGVLAQFYPAHLDAFRVALRDAISTMVARRGTSWSPDSTHAALIRTLEGLPPSDPAVAAAMQQLYAAQELAEQQATPPPPRAPRQSGDNTGETTPGEKAAA